MEEFNNLNLDMGEAFTVRSQFGTHLGALKSWIVMMGQLGIHINSLIDNEKNGHEKFTLDDHADILVNINQNIMRGLEALTGILQHSAKELYGEVFSPDSFVIPELGLELGVGSMEISIDSDLASVIDKLPEEMQEAAIRSLKDLMQQDDAPDELRMKIYKFLQERGE